MKRIQSVGFLIFLLTMIFKCDWAFSQALSARVKSPENKAHFQACSDIPIVIETQPGGSAIKKVAIYENGSLIRSITREPYEFTRKNLPDGIYEFCARITDQSNAEAATDTVIIFVGKVEPGNLILNGEFNCAPSPWRLDQYVGAVATFEIIPDLWLTDDSSGAYIDIQNVGEQYWAVQLMQPFKLQAGHTYEVSFVAEADESKDIEIAISQDYDPYQPHWTQAITVSDYGIYGPYVFACTIDDAKTMFKFVLGGNLIPISIDAVKVIDKMWTDVEVEDTKIIRSYELYQNFPNPFNPITTIDYSIPRQQRIVLDIYNVLGKKIATIIDRVHQPGEHKVQFNAAEFPSGIYFYRLNAGNYSCTKKMTLLR